MLFRTIVLKIRSTNDICSFNIMLLLYLIGPKNGLVSGVVRI